jgi:hypothetical protein
MYFPFVVLRSLKARRVHHSSSPEIVRFVTESIVDPLSMDPNEFKYVNLQCLYLSPDIFSPSPRQVPFNFKVYIRVYEHLGIYM